MYDPKMDEEIEHLFFIMVGALMCYFSSPLMTLAAAFFCIGLRSWCRWRKGEWVVK